MSFLPVQSFKNFFPRPQALEKKKLNILPTATAQQGQVFTWSTRVDTNFDLFPVDGTFQSDSVLFSFNSIPRSKLNSSTLQQWLLLLVVVALAAVVAVVLEVVLLVAVEAVEVSAAAVVPPAAVVVRLVVEVCRAVVADSQSSSN